MKTAKVKDVSVTAGQTVAQAIANLAAAGNTGYLIDWPKIHSQMAAVAVLNRRQHFDLLVTLANGGQVTAAEWNALIGAPALIDTRKAPAGFALPDAHRRWLVDQLDKVSRGRTLGATAAAKLANGAVLTFPTWKVTKRGVESGYRIVAVDMRAAIAFGVLRMLDTESANARELRRCQLNSCGHFYWWSGDCSKSGETRNYCSREHQKAGYNELTAARVARHRRRNA